MMTVKMNRDSMFHRPARHASLIAGSDSRLRRVIFEKLCCDVVKWSYSYGIKLVKSLTMRQGVHKSPVGCNHKRRKGEAMGVKGVAAVSLPRTPALPDLRNPLRHINLLRGNPGTPNEKVQLSPPP